MTYRGRFAPSPSGPLHFGSLVAALGSWLRARAQAGTWLVRIEDIDHVRALPGAAANIIETLNAFGLYSDEPVLHQSMRSDLYAAALARLTVAGHVYPCACSRADLAPFAGIHPAKCVSSAAPRVRRLRVPDATIDFVDHVYGATRQALRTQVGDFVVQRADGGYAYQLAVVVDDAAQRISEVVRGADLLDSTARQILLRDRLELPTTQWLHLPLAVDAEGRKLSKSDRARPLAVDDPLPALRAALDFLGQKPIRERRVERFLAAAAGAFDVTQIPCRPHAHVAMRKD